MGWLCLGRIPARGGAARSEAPGLKRGRWSWRSASLDLRSHLEEDPQGAGTGTGDAGCAPRASPGRGKAGAGGCRSGARAREIAPALRVFPGVGSLTWSLATGREGWPPRERLCGTRPASMCGSRWEIWGSRSKLGWSRGSQVLPQSWEAGRTKGKVPWIVP